MSARWDGGLTFAGSHSLSALASNGKLAARDENKKKQSTFTEELYRKQRVQSSDLQSSTG